MKREMPGTPLNFASLFARATLTACNPEGSHNLVISVEAVSNRFHLSLVEQGRHAVIAIDMLAFLDSSDGFVL